MFKTMSKPHKVILIIITLLVVAVLVILLQQNVLINREHNKLVCHYIPTSDIRSGSLLNDQGPQNISAPTPILEGCYYVWQCQFIDDQHGQDLCYLKVARDQQKEDVCEKIVDNDTRVTCQHELQ